MIIGQCVYLAVAITLIFFGQGLIAIVLAQTLSIVIKRFLSYKVFFSKDLKKSLSAVESADKKQIINAIFPNALKLGLTSLGGFLVNKSSILIGSLFLTLEMVATYGITMQIISILMGLAGVYFSSYLPKVSQYRAKKEVSSLKELYIKSGVIQLLIYIVGGLVLVLAGNWALSLIGSQTKLLNQYMIIVAVFISFLEMNHTLAAKFLLAKNEVPFFKASLWSGFATIVLLWFFLQFTNLGLWSLILAPGIVQAIYQNWKWPAVLIIELNYKMKRK
jgi:O-antigen/teichoic acid export membrane protein